MGLRVLFCNQTELWLEMRQSRFHRNALESKAQLPRSTFCIEFGMYDAIVHEDGSIKYETINYENRRVTEINLQELGVRRKAMEKPGVL